MAETKTFEDLSALKDSEAGAAPVYAKKIDAQGRAYATGKRKNAVARVWIETGAEEGRLSHARQPCGGAQEIWPGQSTPQLPVLQALSNCCPAQRRCLKN